VALVTALEAESRSGGIRVRVDARPQATVSASDIAELHLAKGVELDAAALAELDRRAEAFGARVVALRILAARPVPSGEMLRRLMRKGHPRPAAEAAVRHLVESGLVDDAEIARHYVRTRVRQRRLGPGRLAADLRRMGIAEREAAAAVAEALEQEGVDAGSVLREAAHRKLRSLAGLEPRVARRRLAAHLRRRGFGVAEIRAALNEVMRSRA